ncbi:isoprenylcysteine carboxyl methyltransferase family protein [Fodinicurvata fenggangensis]|uniref:isoprenylcysteine carboxyl methyltransferase family protein n=1 Tax=Fodinicurvata fenggangensis TaxID=1121830 RepID=UPI00054CF933|nr:isoprenylcysteine carboxylmethyltransferase family protein [Fodinicurvata fenggangensis]
MPLASLVLAIVTLQRLAELVLSNRNTARLIERGGVEKSPGHYPVIVILHATWLALLWIMAAGATVDLSWLAVFGVLQGLRVWVISTLGKRWTTRIIVVPGEARVRRGPYRYVDHPNYLIVVAEFIALPMALGQPLIAIVFTLLNAAVLWVRIRAEALALDEAEPHR